VSHEVIMDKSEFTNRVLEAEPTLYHISKSILKNDFDCADAVQEVVNTLFKYSPV
jgi:RNA polymerase sigma-70 factor (ECF subfamily)